MSLCNRVIPFKSDIQKSKYLGQHKKLREIEREKEEARSEKWLIVEMSVNLIILIVFRFFFYFDTLLGSGIWRDCLRGNMKFMDSFFEPFVFYRLENYFGTFNCLWWWWCYLKFFKEPSEVHLAVPEKYFRTNYVFWWVANNDEKKNDLWWSRLKNIIARTTISETPSKSTHQQTDSNKH